MQGWAADGASLKENLWNRKRFSEKSQNAAQRGRDMANRREPKTRGKWKEGSDMHLIGVPGEKTKAAGVGGWRRLSKRNSRESPNIHERHQSLE